MGFTFIYFYCLEVLELHVTLPRFPKFCIVRSSEEMQWNGMLWKQENIMPKSSLSNCGLWSIFKMCCVTKHCIKYLAFCLLMVYNKFTGRMLGVLMY